MRTIKVLGTGCKNCLATESLIKKIAEEQNMEVNIIKVEDIQDIMAYDVMSTPAVVIDEKVVIKGRVPSVAEVRDLLHEDDCSDDSDYSCCSTEEKDSGSCCCS